MKMEKPFTMVVFTENKIGLLNRVTSSLIQRHINIESLTVSESEFPGIHRFTIVIIAEEEKVMKVVKQIEKQVEILKAYYFSDEQTAFSEIALFKVNVSHGDDKSLQSMIDQYQLKELSKEGEFLILEKTGKKEETQQVFDALKPMGLQGFVRSGRISLSKTIGSFSGHLKELELHSKEIITKYN